MWIYKQKYLTHWFCNTARFYLYCNDVYFLLCSCSDDGTVRVWDFFSCREERVLRGHGADVKCVDWHPTQGLLASGSKGNH